MTPLPAVMQAVSELVKPNLHDGYYIGTGIPNLKRCHRMSQMVLQVWKMPEDETVIDILFMQVCNRIYVDVVYGHKVRSQTRIYDDSTHGIERVAESVLSWVRKYQKRLEMRL